MEYVGRSQNVLVFLTSGYFQSQVRSSGSPVTVPARYALLLLTALGSRLGVTKNCMRELLRAVIKKKPIVALLEPDASRGGLTARQVHHKFAAAQVNSMYSAWGLEAEVAEWGHAVPGPQQLGVAVFRRGQIEWNRKDLGMHAHT